MIRDLPAHLVDHLQQPLPQVDSGFIVNVLGPSVHPFLEIATRRDVCD